jgi:recombinational DNA repair protein RecT
MSAACLGLEVDGVTGQAYLIPFKNKAQLVIGYKGMNTMAARSGITITGAVVRDGDEFDFALGTDAFVRHVPKLGSEGRIIAAWAVGAALGRPHIISAMGIDDLLAIKAKAPGARRTDSPWNEPLIGFPAMCEKTAKRRLSRSLPLNIMTKAARMDEAVEEQGLNAWISPDKGVIIEGEVVDKHHHSETPTAETLIGGDRDGEDRREDESEADPLMVWDAALGDAATRGMNALQECWSKVPRAHQTALKAALDRRHKETAAKVDATPGAGAPTSEQPRAQPTPANTPAAEADAPAPSGARLL